MHYCHICETSQSEGIFIYQLYVCETCQTKMIATDPEDPNYRFFINKLRKMRKLPLKNEIRQFPEEYLIFSHKRATIIVRINRMLC